MFAIPKPDSDEMYEHEIILSSSPVSETTVFSFSEPTTPSISAKVEHKSNKSHLSFRAFKSKRVAIMNDDSAAPSEKTPNLSDGELLDVKPKKKKNRAIKLIKKLSLRKKHKVGPKVEEPATNNGGGSSSSATTPGSIKRHTPEGATLSMSEGSLHNDETTDPSRKAETVQITISSKKIEKINQAETNGEQRKSDRVSPNQHHNKQFVFESHNDLIEANPMAAPITAITEITTKISSNNGNANTNNRNNYETEQTLILLEKESTSNPISRDMKMSELTTTSTATTNNAQPILTATKIIETITTTRTEQIDQFPSSSNTKPVVLAGIEKEKSTIEIDQTQISTDNDQRNTFDQGAQLLKKVNNSDDGSAVKPSDEERVGQIVASIVLAQSKLAPSILISKPDQTVAKSENSFMKKSEESKLQASTADDGSEDPSKVHVLNDPVQLGNSLKNRNFTPFISVPSTALHIREVKDGSEKLNSSDDPASDVGTSEIKFDIGTPVRPQRTSESRKLQHFATLDSHPLHDSENSLDSIPSEANLSRRRISYVQQPTFYTSAEKELLIKAADLPTTLASELKMAGESSMSSLQFPNATTSEDDTVVVNDDNDDEEASNMTTEKREHLYKILVIGELGTGKTSFIKRYVHQFFSQNYRATIGVDFALKVLNWDQDTIIRLQLWDIAGQERFGNMTRVYYKEAVGAFIVFDVTRSATFDAVIKWKQDLDSKVQLADGSPIPCILLANKCDQSKQGIVTTPAKLDEFVKENGFAGWFETSAKDNINIEDAAKALVNKILLNDKLTNGGDLADPERIALNGKAETPKKGCVC